MASKKVQSLVSSSTDSSEVLAAAGVEVKLTKSELAEYVKEKALQTLRAKVDVLTQQRDLLNIKRVEIEDNALPPRVQAVTVAIRTFKPDAVASIAFSHCGKHFWRVTDKNDKYNYHFTSDLDLVAEADYIPASYGEWKKLDEQIDEINEQIRQIEKKNFKAFMVENVLNGSDAGKVVIASLDEMVAKLVG